ncbi:MAG: hypothetical protein MI919_35745, partial [Holophagales bacterium]|nr:hypothetical protein [Holophagales bacterium]
MKSLVPLFLALLMVAPTYADEVLPYTSPVEKSEAARITEAAALYSWVSSFAAREKSTAMEAAIPLARLAELNSPPNRSGRLLIGVSGAVGFAFNPAQKAAHGTTVFAEGRMVWTGSFSSPGATGVRLHLDKVRLPAGVELYVFDRHGQAFGPYTAGDKDGHLWTHTVAGHEIMLQVHVPLASRHKGMARDMFRVSELVHMGSRYEFGYSAEKAFCSWNDSCIT